MKLQHFSLELGTVEISAVGQAAFFALIAAGWSMYASSMLAISARGVDISAMTEAERAKHAEGCFRYVIQWMPDDHPYRTEIERYIFDALPADLPATLPSPAW